MRKWHKGATPDEFQRIVSATHIYRPERRRAREPYAPDFSVTTADGEYIALEDLRGKVVLVDFWGTWCPPCVASVPSLRDLHKRYAKENSFVMIGISVHDEEDRWHAFTARNQMVRPQYLDRDGKIQRAFGVNRFPTYILIDHEGIVRFRVSGMSFEREATLKGRRLAQSAKSSLWQTHLHIFSRPPQK